MNNQQLQRPTRTTRQAHACRWQWLGLGLIGIVAVLAISFYAAWADYPLSLRYNVSITDCVMYEKVGRPVNA